MKKSFSLLLIFLLISGALTAQIDSTSNQDNSKARVCFYRPTRFAGSLNHMKILANNEAIIRLKNRSYYNYYAPAGEYLFSCNLGNESKLKLKLESGKTYYIKCSINPGFWSAVPELELEDAILGKSLIDGGGLKELQYESISIIKLKSRIGIFIGVGGGFESIPMGQAENGDNLTLSTGGGGALGLEYGYEITKHFDLSANCFFQGSSLSKNVRNGSATFNRMGILITPAYIIPLGKSDFFRLKLGGGLGLYSLGTMAINASKAGGEDLILKYNPSIGIHTAIIFEGYISEKSSMTFGLKYYNVHYHYSTEGSSGIGTDQRILIPNGSGIDFTIGYNYHF
jgi:hypothetical protein